MAAKQNSISAQDVQAISGVGRGDLVRLVGFTGRATGVTAIVSRFTSRGVWVTTKVGTKECWHPSDVRRVRKAVKA